MVKEKADALAKQRSTFFPHQTCSDAKNSRVFLSTYIWYFSSPDKHTAEAHWIETAVLHRADQRQLGDPVEHH